MVRDRKRLRGVVVERISRAAGLDLDLGLIAAPTVLCPYTLPVKAGLGSRLPVSATGGSLLELALWSPAQPVVACPACGLASPVAHTERREGGE